jgi:predicted peptidase
MPELLEAVDHVVAEHKVDSTRLYITGQSMGGLGT